MKSENSDPRCNLMFDKLVPTKSMEEICRSEPSQLIKLLKNCGTQFQGQIQKDTAKGYVFFMNYHKLLNKHAKITHDSSSNNLSLHFALLLSYFMLKQENIISAKQVLKQTESFILSTNPDPILLSIAFNNLALLYFKTAKYAKSAATSLKVIHIMCAHLKILKKSQQPKSRISQDAIILINLLIIAQKSIQKLIDLNNKSSLKNIFKIVNDAGFIYSSKYLGEQSYLTKKFIIPDDSIYLPVVVEEQPVKTDKKHKLLKNLDKIFTILSKYKYEPEIVQVKELQAPPVLQIIENDQFLEDQISFSDIFILNKWKVEIKMLKDPNLEIPADQKEEYIKKTQFICSIFNKIKRLLIQKEKMKKIVSLLHVRDVLPYEFQIKNLKTKEFLNKVLINFLSINEEQEEFMIHPRANSLIQPFLISFCKEDVIIFINHIRFNQYRLAICPTTNSEQIYLDIEFKGSKFNDLIEVEDVKNQLTNQICMQLYQNELKQRKVNQLSKARVFVRNAQELKQKIVQILSQFEQFLIQEQESYDIKLFQIIQNSHYFTFYKYVELQDRMGKFYILRYRQNLNAFEVYLQNNFKTHSPSGMTKAKGNAMYFPQSFYKDFGISSREIKKIIGAFCEILYQKYSLSVCNEPINDQEEKVYSQNALTQVMIVSKSYKRRLILFQDYYIPVTIEIVTINNEIPIGIRIIAYDSANFMFMPHFIYVFSKDWQIPKEAIPKKQQNEMSQMQVQVKMTIQDYKFKHGYFLVKWMQVQGFQKIFNKIRIVNRNIQIEGIRGRFSRIQQILPLI